MVTTIKPSFKMFLVKLQKIICFQYIALFFITSNTSTVIKFVTKKVEL